MSIGVQRGPRIGCKVIPLAVCERVTDLDQAPWRFDRPDLVGMAVVDGLQRFDGGAILKAFGQGLEPRTILGLQGDHGGDVSC
jgi:hypothetical protein